MSNLKDINFMYTVEFSSMFLVLSFGITELHTQIIIEYSIVNFVCGNRWQYFN